MQALTVAEFEESRFFRPPDWRYRRALSIASSTGIDRGIGDDKDTIKLAHFLKLELRKSQRRTVTAVSRHSTPVSAAFRLYSVQHYDRLKQEVQWRCLAGQSIVEISSITGLPPSILDEYERTYFDVRSRLESAEYIYSVVIDPQDTPITAMQRLAYCVGPAIIDVLLALLPIYISLGKSAEGPELRAAAESHELLSQLISANRRPTGRLFDITNLELPTEISGRDVDKEEKGTAEVVPVNLLDLRIYERLAG